MKTEETPLNGAACVHVILAAGYASETLGDSEKAAFERHMVQCPACRETAEALQATVCHLRTAMPAVPAFDILPAVRHYLSQQDWTAKAQVGGMRRFAYWARRAAALLLAVLAAGLWLRRPVGHEPVARLETAAPAAMREVAQHDAVQWLASVQEADGSWSAPTWGGRQEYETALTGMAVLALLRHKDGRHPAAATVVPAAVDALIRRQRADGGLGAMSTGHMYNHGIATVALLEARRHGYALSTDTALPSALAFIRKSQRPTGGWGYDAHGMSSPNTSVSVWQLEALALAVAQGWSESGFALEQGLDWLKTMANEQGQFGYRQTADTTDHAALTAMGAYCLFKAAGFPSASDPSGRALARRALHRVAEETEAANLDFYRSYFIASVLKASADPGHQRHLARLQGRLARERHQQAPYAGSWTPSDQWSDVGGRIYATTLAAMMLETQP